MPEDIAAPEPPSKRAKSRSGRWLFFFLVGCVVLLVLLDRDWSGKPAAPPTEWIEYDGHRWGVTPVEYFRQRGLDLPEAPPDENAALDYAIAGKLLPARPSRETDDQREYVMRYGWTAECNLLWSYIQDAQPALERVELGQTKKGYAEPLKMESGYLYDISLPHLTNLREIGRVFVYRGKLAEAEGRQEDALDDYLAGLWLGNDVAQGPFTIQSLVAIAVDQIAFQAIASWVLSAPSPDLLRETLFRLREIQENKPDPLSSILKERVCCLDAVRSLGGTDFRFCFQSYGPLFGRSRIVRGCVKTRLNTAYAIILRCATLHGRSRYIALRDVETDIEDLARGWLAGSVMQFSPPITRFIIQLDRAELQWRAVEVRIGLALYKAEHGRYPEKLDEIAPYLGVIPLDPFTEEPFLYRLEENEYVFYSVGPDLTDNGGVDARTDRTRLLDATWYNQADLVCSSKLVPPPPLNEYIITNGHRPNNGWSTERAPAGE